MIRKPTEAGKNYAKINFEAISVSDNSGEKIDAICFNVGTGKKCDYELGKAYNIKITYSRLELNFKATDSSGNSAICRFTVVVEGMLSRFNVYIQTKFIDFLNQVISDSVFVHFDLKMLEGT